MDKKEITDILINNFGLTIKESELDSESQYLKRLQLILSERLEFLIRTDLDRLLQILYRIDVPQKDSDDAFDLGEVKKISFQLAEKIINRQLQKIDYAKKFYKRD
ncbi:MAG: hypothetical protein ACJAS4_000042 [Bacteriovoracaceae bacterium]|jgi:hypothetical protein